MDNQEIKYWNTFYNLFDDLEPSNFAIFVYNYFKSKENISTVLDIGCGNGRDSYFLSKNYSVIGVDISVKPKDTNNCVFILDDMVKMNKGTYDLIYSRFTFHSITNEDQEKLIKSVEPNSYLCIETRSDKGINIERYYGDNHYRNLTNIDYIKTLLISNNFDILFIEEDTNFAKYKTENPICIRIISKKLRI